MCVTFRRCGTRAQEEERDQKQDQPQPTKNKKSKYAADVISNEINNKNKSKILKFSKNNDQVLITTHIGGMTKEAQSIA